uniref:Uncharacterized protein n=1 Tax=Odontella aurita TaxID=265563 RepID=A0A7S4IU73_9STRA|mmetsp:Transcript_3037/g.7906  ORF Transcript_3037/g.7906 Transcript_3037/m.7906 type:complete len:199 (+) Transcript_3037:1004-1600(+)
MAFQEEEAGTSDEGSVGGELNQFFDRHEGKGRSTSGPSQEAGSGTASVDWSALGAFTSTPPSEHSSQSKGDDGTLALDLWEDAKRNAARSRDVNADRQSRLERQNADLRKSRQTQLTETITRGVEARARRETEEALAQSRRAEEEKSRREEAKEEQRRRIASVKRTVDLSPEHTYEQLFINMDLCVSRCSSGSSDFGF